MKVDARELTAALLPAALFALLLAAAGGLLAATMDASERAALWTVVGPRMALLLMLWLVSALAAGLALRAAWLRFGAAPGRLAEAVQVLIHTDAPARLDSRAGSAGSRALAVAVNTLVVQRNTLRQGIATKVAEASRDVEQERQRLASLIAGLPQSVVVCNLDGRILLFNARARLQFRALAAVAVVPGFDAIALGRSIYAVLDRGGVAHALEAVQQRLQRGAAYPSAQFVTGTQGGQLLRVQMTPVKAPDAPEGTPLNGFVLMVDNIARDMAEVTAEGLRSLKTRWPMEDMLGADFVAAAARRIESQHGARVIASEVDAQLWLRVDSYTLIQALLHLSGRLADEYGVRRVQLRLSLAPAGSAGAADKAQLDLVWAAQAISSETVTAWETEAIQAGASSSPLTVRDVLERHGGTLWFERARVRQEACFRLLLPLAVEAAAMETAAVTAHASRPEFYDFDLFAHAAHAAAGHALADRPLSEIAYTVFDTETTGLQPSQGDGIIQIGATRIVAGKLRRQACFEQLVDPQRPLSAAGIAIHGIEPAMLRGQPLIKAVLPAFHAFAQDTVLVAHNAAFDMRFLQLQEAATGIVFDQPVLDTLLLSAVVHPQQASHRLEAIAERLGVTLLGRHTALGDAMVTAEVFVRLLPLLQAMGIHTLGQALAASKQTGLAQVSY